MKVLFLGANGLDTSRLRIAAELRDIQAEIERAKERKQIEIRAELAVRPADLSRVLLDEKPDVVHFSGHGIQLNVAASTSQRQTRDFQADEDEPANIDHGKKDSVLLFENCEGKSAAVPPEAVASLFGILKSQRCVVLNACFSATQAKLISEHVDCVIGMKRTIDDQASLVFSAGFYQALSRGTSVVEAFELGRNLIALCGFPDADVPDLVCRDGVDPKTVYLVKEPTKTVVVPHVVPRKTIARVLAIFVVAIIITSVTYWAKPLSLPPIKAGHGAVVVVMPRNPFDSARKSASDLCAALDYTAQGTEPKAICLSRGHFDHDDSLREQALRAGVSVLVMVDEFHMMRMYPLGKLADHDLFAQHIPAVDISRSSILAPLAPLLREWARVADGAPDGTLDIARLHCGQSVADEVFGVALSSLLLRRMATNCPSRHDDVSALRPQCREETCTMLDGLEVKEAPHPHNCDQETDDRLRLGCFRKHAFSACQDGRAVEAEQWSRLMDAQQNPFYAITAAGVAACILSHGKGLSTEQRARLDARAARHEGNCEMPACGAVSGQCGYCAAAIAERAGYWAHACEWVRMERDYEQAYRLSQDNEHLLGMVEAALHQFSTAVAERLAKRTSEDLKKLVNRTKQQAIRAALLEWVAAKREGNKTYVDAMEKSVIKAYDLLPAGEFVYARESPDEVERGLLCHRRAKQCVAYDLLTVPKDAATPQALREALRSAVLPVRGLCAERP